MKFKLVTWGAVKQCIKMQKQCFDLPFETIQQQISFFQVLDTLHFFELQ